MSEVWTTRVPPERTRPYGVEELYRCAFEPPGWPGAGPVITLLVPECELQVVFPGKSLADTAVMLNRPQNNRNVKRWTRSVCELVTRFGALLVFSCDTVEQTEVAARRVAKLLPKYQRMALERLDDVSARAKGKLS